MSGEVDKEDRANSDLYRFKNNLDAKLSAETYFKFELDHGVLRPLGDGTYGMVFPAFEGTADDPKHASEQYAVKVLYRHQVPVGDKSPGARSRIQRARDELRIGTTLSRRLSQTVKTWSEAVEAESNREDRDDMTRALTDFKSASTVNAIRECLVLPLASTESFNGFGDLRLEDTGLQFSTFAYVMERCDASLKDILESGEPVVGDGDKDDDRHIGAAPNPGLGSDELAYPRLAEESLFSRVREALEVAIQLARSLQVLHAAGYRHHDVKPANIYFVKGQNGRRYFKLGDLGFLQSVDALDRQPTYNLLEGESGGTIHFRSPEQRHGRDVAECSVNGGRGTALLTTRDPKFWGTRLDPGDFAYFAKDGDQNLMVVSRVRREPSGEIEIDVRDPNGTIDYTDVQKTQVGFVKRATTRTDLFGLGAVMYDIITAGRSPERFHDRLLPFDREDHALGPTVLEHYQPWLNGGVSNPILSDLFLSLHRDTDPPDSLPESVVRVLLSLMASGAKDSFYHAFSFESDNRKSAAWQAALAWYRVIQELEAVKHDLDLLAGGPLESPVLTTGERVATPNADRLQNGGGRTSLRELLAELAAERNLGTRWLRAARLVEAYGSLVSYQHRHDLEDWNSMYPSGSDLVAMASNGKGLQFLSAPRAVTTPIRPTADRGPESGRDSLAELLRGRDPLLMRQATSLDRSEPFWWFEQKREVDLQFSGFRSCTILYRPFSAATWTANPGDFLIPASGTRSDSPILEVSAVDSGHSTRLVSRCEVSMHGNSEPTDGRYYLVRRPEPVDYYAGTVAMYLYMALFGVKAPTAGASFPEVPERMFRWARQRPLAFQRPSKAAAELVKRNQKRSAFRRAPDPMLQQWSAVTTHTFLLLSWLFLGGFQETGDEDGQWDLVTSEVRKWRERVEAFWLPGASTEGWPLRDVGGKALEHVKDHPGLVVDRGDWTKVLTSYEGRFGQPAPIEVPARPARPVSQPAPTPAPSRPPAAGAGDRPVRPSGAKARGSKGDRPKRSSGGQNPKRGANPPTNASRRQPPPRRAVPK